MDSNSLYNHLERLSELLRTDLRKSGIKHGLQPVQLEVLHYLSVCNRYSDTPLAVSDYLGQTKGTVSQTIKVLEQKGLLLRRTDAGDKRVSHLGLTAKGSKLLDRLVPPPMLTNACDNLSKKARTQINHALNQLVMALLQSNGMKSFGVCHTCRYNGRAEDGGYYCNLVQQPLTVDDVQRICREHEAAA
ncbi:MAG: MarR family winged helix-turn-helix transcriptional regulator [Candidatus Thiodiazotropha lotti]|nr:MarR family winged helix-turn-helix transcriptional regulator [Candidatus Thiodiazotropha lotti]MCW4185389.1 MarR family winged helix-turn-helix transcriptional regulator [Candidatus Thiodiazotropha weberae]